MDKKTKNIIAGALAVVGVYLLFKYFRKDKDTKPVTPIEPPKPIVPSGDSKNNYPLKKGSKGSNVKIIQDLILNIDSSLLPKFGADGDFGSETEAAVQKLLGKKSVDDAKDYGKLLALYNQKIFPLISPKPNTGVGFPSGLPTYKPPFTL